MRNVIKCIPLFTSAFFLGSIYSSSVFAQDNLEIQTKRNFEKVVVVFLENQGYDAAAKQPFFKNLLSKGALLTNFYAETHPSQPNYIAFVSGSFEGVTGNENVDLTRSHIGDLLEKKGFTWKNYAEGLPSKCFLGSNKKAYARKHVPFFSFTNVTANSNRCSLVVSADTFINDARTGELPHFSFYSPDLNNDGHDTGMAYGARAMERTFGPLLADANITKNTLFVFTFDEDDGSNNNHIFTIMVGANVKPGVSVNTKYNHYDLLRTIEDEFQVGNLGLNDAAAQSITGVWRD